MLFNSDVFLRFFGAFLLLYLLARSQPQARNLLIVAASYVFYGWWDYRFLALLFASSVLDYAVGLGLGRTEVPRQRRLWLALSLAGNLGMLGFFKYYNFFVDSAVVLLGRLGLPAEPRTLEVLLPVGISFYTFQTMSYALDVYRRQLEPTRDFVGFLAYVSFFPQLVAGPIERASHLLPQFSQVRLVTRAALEAGVWLVLWGMFKKVVVADNLAPLVELAYHPDTASGPVVALGTVAFALQIYGDFSGYSDIARGLARLLGFDLMLNFNLPYCATNLREFWRRWHISLSTWLRDYLYISLGGNRRGPGRTAVNLALTMALGGLWHGAAWNFVLWGLWHGLGLLVHRLWRQRVRPRLPDLALRPSDLGPRPSDLRPPTSDFGPRTSGALLRPSSFGFRPSAFVLRICTAFLRSSHFASRICMAFLRLSSFVLRFSAPASWALTMAFVLYGWLLFRAGSLEQVASMTLALGNWTAPDWLGQFAVNLAFFALPLVGMQFWQWRTGDLEAPLRLPVWARATVEAALLLAILLYWRRDAAPFIYFQF